MRISSNTAVRPLQPRTQVPLVTRQPAEPPKVAARFERLAQLGQRVNLDRATIDKASGPVMQAISQQLDQAAANGEFASVQRAGDDLHVMFRGANGVSAFYEKQGQAFVQNGTLGSDKATVTWSPASPVAQADSASQVQRFTKSYALDDAAKAAEVIKDFQNNSGWLFVPGMRAGADPNNPAQRVIDIPGAQIIEREAERGPGSSTYVIDEAPPYLAQDYRATWKVSERGGKAYLDTEVSWREPKPDPAHPGAYERPAFNQLLDTVFTQATKSMNHASIAPGRQVVPVGDGQTLKQALAERQLRDPQVVAWSLKHSRDLSADGRQLVVPTNAGEALAQVRAHPERYQAALDEAAAR